MGQIAPWERVFVRCAYWFILLVSVGGIVGALVRMRRSGVKLTWDTALYALGIVALVWSPEILSAIAARYPSFGQRAIEVFLFAGACLIAWLYFGPGRRDRT